MGTSQDILAVEERLSAFRAELVANLNDAAAGSVTCRISAHEGEVGDELAMALALARQIATIDFPDSAMVEIDDGEARDVASELFRGSPWGPKKRSTADAGRVTADLFQLFGPNPRFFSTLKTVAAEGSSYVLGRGLLGNSFEAGFFFVGPSRSGALWFADED